MFEDFFNTEEAVWQLPTKSVTDNDEKLEGGAKTHSKRRTTELLELSSKYLYRRAFGEDQLLQKLGTEPFKIGHSYHCITGGNVDSLSFLKVNCCTKTSIICCAVLGVCQPRTLSNSRNGWKRGI